MAMITSAGQDISVHLLSGETVLLRGVVSVTQEGEPAEPHLVCRSACGVVLRRFPAAAVVSAERLSSFPQSAPWF
jgi:hypothetical protein